MIEESLKKVSQVRTLNYPCDCNFNFLTRYRKERLVVRIVSQGVATFAPPSGEAGFDLMATDDIKPLKLGGSHPLLDESSQGSKKSKNISLKNKYYGTNN